MKRRTWLAALTAVVLLSSAVAAADREIYVIADTLTAVGTKITSAPCAITKAGFYYLGNNLAFAGSGNAITISADDVTLDLMGFCIGVPEPIPAGKGIYMSGRKNVEIRNGTISGFYYGIFEASAASANHRILNVRVSKFRTAGIRLNGQNNLVQGCNCSDCTAAGCYGIYVGNGAIVDCEASNNNGIGFYLSDSGSLLGNIAKSNKKTGFAMLTGIILADRNTAAYNSPNYYGPDAMGQVTWGVNAGR